jgi:excisionase family DNA binding protein
MNEIKLSFEPQAIEVIRTIIREELDRRTEELKKNPKSFTRNKVCEILNISLPTLDKHIHEGRIEAKKIGRKIFIPEKSIEKFLNGYVNETL